MIERLTKEGREKMITNEIMDIMDNLDGQKAIENCWERQVNNNPVYWVIGKNGKGEYVNENDCM